MITWEGFEEQVPSEAVKEEEAKTRRTNGWNEKEDKMEEEEETREKRKRRLQ